MDIDFNSIENLKENNFTGFFPISHLQETRCKDVAKIRGIYFVLHLLNTKPSFLENSIGGHYKGRNPTVNLEKLNMKWVKGVKVIYIGKTGGENSKESLKSRIWCYMRFGQGNPTAHWGGRYIWQIYDSNLLQICWKPIPNENPRDIEKNLIEKFENQFGQLPFANLQH